MHTWDVWIFFSEASRLAPGSNREVMFGSLAGSQELYVLMLQDL